MKSDCKVEGKKQVWVMYVSKLRMSEVILGTNYLGLAALVIAGARAQERAGEM